jgi:Cys-rich repeat protein
MTRNKIRLLTFAHLAMTILFCACGSHATPARATGTAGAGANSATAGTVATGAGAGANSATAGSVAMGAGAGTSSAGTGNTSGSAGRGTSGTAGSAGGVPNGRIACGTANNGTGCNANPSSNNICDLPNNRCVDCMTDTDCAVEPPNVHCDVRPNAQGLATYSCEECTDNSHCPAGATCTNAACGMPCGTAMCRSDETCDLPNNRCVECKSDTDCTGQTTNSHCDLQPNAAGLPTGTCEECVETSHCPTGQICVNNNCEPTCATDADCTASGANNPYCHPATRICGECGTDAHCASDMANPYCSAEARCEECITDAHCATQPTQPYCVGNNCSQCMTNAQCTDPTLPYCDDGDCVACRTSADCTTPQTCNNRGTCTGA